MKRYAGLAALLIATWLLTPAVAQQYARGGRFADGTAAAPSMAFASETTKGFYSNAASQIAVTIGSTARMTFTGAGLNNIQDAGLYTLGAAADVVLARDAAGTLALKNSTNAQSFNIYGSTTGPIRIHIQAGTPVVSTCGDGALQTGSTDFSGRVVGTTQTACTLTFSVSMGGNASDCTMNNLTANRGNITAASSTAFTVSNLTAGDDFTYVCVGR